MKYSFPCFITYCFFIMLPAESYATCYTVYNSSDKAVYKSSAPPFDMSISISENIKSKYPGGYLLQDNSASCSLPKAGDVTGESINNRIKNGDKTAGQRDVAIQVRTGGEITRESGKCSFEYTPTVDAKSKYEKLAFAAKDECYKNEELKRAGTNNQEKREAYNAWKEYHYMKENRRNALLQQGNAEAILNRHGLY